MWSGTIATIPDRFQLCDGTNGTPDLRDRFIICAKQDDVGVQKATIEGALKLSGGVTGHMHTIAGGSDIAIPPVGGYATTTDSKYNYPPCFSLAYIQRMS